MPVPSLDKKRRMCCLAHEFGRGFGALCVVVDNVCPSGNVAGQLQRKRDLPVDVGYSVMSHFLILHYFLSRDLKPELLGSDLNPKHLTHANLPLLL